MKTEPDVCLHRNLLCRFVVQCGGWCVCVSGQPGEAAPEGPGIPGLGTPPIPLRLRLGAAPGHDPLSHCVSCVWEARQPRGPIGDATKQLGPVLLGGRTHMAAAHPASGLTRDGQSTHLQSCHGGRMEYGRVPETRAAVSSRQLRKPEDGETAFSPSSGKDAGAASQAGCPGQPRLS